MKHTPGPWGFEDKDNLHMVTAGKDRKGRFVYVCDPSYSPRGNESANAKLIVAAPELLKALRATTNVIRNILTDSQLDTRTKCGKSIRQWYGLCEAAIRKVR